MKAFLKHAWLVMIACLALAGCGGTGGSDDGGDDGGGGTTPSVTVAVAIYDSNGNATSSVTSSSPGTVRATVRNNGSAVSGVVVQFTTTSIGTLNPSSGTALTDSSGVASITLNAGNVAGAGEVIATVTNPAEATGRRAFTTSVTTNTVSMNLTVSNASVSAGGTTTLTATLTNSDGSPFTTVLPVSFASQCATSGQAVLDVSVNTNNGVANSTYRAQGCVGSDTITASVNAGSLLTDTVNVTVAAATVGSITFVSASPTSIAIRGTGGAGRSETSTVRFQVRDQQGNSVANQTVNFTLDTTVGGLALAPPTANTDSNGYVQTVVTSGSVATSVKVTATVATTAISTQSDNLVVSTGIPDQDSFSLSASNLNPEGWDIDGVQVAITARLADAFNNPVPNGTAIQFRAEGGAIDSSCTTTGGACTVIWRSQAPRPVGLSFNNIDGVGTCATVPEQVNSCGQPIGGRVTILATAIGEESFPDTNGNGKFDESENATFQNGTDVQGNPWDVPEAFLDHNEDDGFQISAGTEDDSESFVDFNNNGAYNADDNQYNGVLCGNNTAGTGPNPFCATQKSIHVRSSLVLSMSGSDLYGRWSQVSVNVTGAATATVALLIADLHNQVPPSGTTITCSTSNGSVVSGASQTMGSRNANGGYVFFITVKGDTTSSTGSLVCVAETPSGVQTPFAITVVD